jgi:hypothetical protein
MLSHRVVLTSITTAAMAMMVTVTQTRPAPAEYSSASYNFLVASGFLCDPNDSTACPAVARTANGDSVEIRGAGTLSLASPGSTSVQSALCLAPTEALDNCGFRIVSMDKIPSCGGGEGFSLQGWVRADRREPTTPLPRGE